MDITIITPIAAIVGIIVGFFKIKEHFQTAQDNFEKEMRDEMYREVAHTKDNLEGKINAVSNEVTSVDKKIDLIREDIHKLIEIITKGK